MISLMMYQFKPEIMTDPDNPNDLFNDLFWSGCVDRHDPKKPRNLKKLN